jgi:hypothetical protein
MVSNKYAHAPAEAVKEDLKENHNRKISCSFIRSTSQIVSNLLLKQEENWSEYGAKRFLPIRAICLTEGRWNQAWDKFMGHSEMLA